MRRRAAIFVIAATLAVGPVEAQIQAPGPPTRNNSARRDGTQLSDVATILPSPDGGRAAPTLVASLTGAGPVERPPWRILSVTDIVAARALRSGLDQAWRRLGDNRCSQLLSEFTDRDGRSLAQRLATLGVDAQTYLTMVVFLETRHEICFDGVLAFTAPGSRVVRVCSEALKRTWRDDAAYTAAAFIHEMLHTLGLGENPPSSNEITRSVLARCSPQKE